MQIRRFLSGDEAAISALVRRNLLEINVRDYPLEEVKALSDRFTDTRIREQAGWAHMYVVCDGETIVGTGSIAAFWGSETESILLTIFVLPEYHGRGVGRMIMESLESDEFFLRARRIEIPASKTACQFYEKLGYSYKGGVKAPDESGYFRMEKFRDPL